jgi:flagellar biosynthetic protein FlhB
MAEEDSGQERSEQATERRTEEARRQGQIPRSKELTTVLTLLLCSLVLYATGRDMFATMHQLMAQAFAPNSADLLFNASLLYPFVMAALIAALKALTPFLLASVAVALFAPLLVGGWNLTFEALNLNFDRLDPVQGLKKVFGLQGVVEALKALVKFVLIGALAATGLYLDRYRILNVGHGAFNTAVSEGMWLIGKTFLFSVLAMALITCFDVPYQVWSNSRKLRMTRQELREESKETDGRPEVKSRIRRLQQEMSQKRMMQEVPKADVVVTNPAHYAVALRYDPANMGAPIVVAKGAAEVAARIRALAEEHHVPLFASPRLARALYAHTKVDEAIPARLYVAVARVLSHIFELRRAAYAEQPLQTPDPDQDVPVDLDIPMVRRAPARAGRVP